MKQFRYPVCTISAITNGKQPPGSMQLCISIELSVATSCLVVQVLFLSGAGFDFGEDFFDPDIDFDDYRCRTVEAAIFFARHGVQPTRHELVMFLILLHSMSSSHTMWRAICCFGCMHGIQRIWTEYRCVLDRFCFALML
jgi:hypothetical protein